MLFKKLNGPKLDSLLKDALSKQTPSTPPDFTDRIMTQIRLEDEREILAQVVLKERLALVACVFLAIGSFFAMVAFTQIPVRVIESIKIIAGEIPTVLQSVIGTWQLLVVFAAILGFTVYIFFNDLKLGYRS